jgi:hypothetical protein
MTKLEYTRPSKDVLYVKLDVDLLSKFRMQIYARAPYQNKSHSESGVSCGLGCMMLRAFPTEASRLVEWPRSIQVPVTDHVTADDLYSVS